VEKKPIIFDGAVIRQPKPNISIYCMHCGEYLKPYLEEYVLKFCPECGKEIDPK